MPPEAPKTHPAATDSPIIEAVGLRKSYDTFVAVDGIDFAVRPGECFGFLGPNGAGKTTTMRMIYRHSPISGGRLRVLGYEVGDGENDREIKRRIGVVPQENNLDQELSVRENLDVFCRFYGLSRRERKARVGELIEFVNLVDKADVSVLKLSGGMKRRVMIARGLIGHPPVIVLDEPTTGLDPQARQNLWEQLFLLKQQHATLLLTTHYMDEAEQLCDRLVIMDRGKIVAEGRPRDLIAAHVPAHVVEVRLNSADEVPIATAKLAPHADRHEVLRNRVLLYGDDGEGMIARVAHDYPDRDSLIRRATLEDVFLKLTGRELDE